MQTTAQAIQLEKTRLVPSVALGFFIVGLLSIAATLAIIAPVMEGSSLFNDRLTFYHLMLHASCWNPMRHSVWSASSGWG